LQKYTQNYTVARAYLAQNVIASIDISSTKKFEKFYVDIND